MELATERDAKWLSSVVCYEILTAGPAGKLLAVVTGPENEGNMAASCLADEM